MGSAGKIVGRALLAGGFPLDAALRPVSDFRDIQMVVVSTSWGVIVAQRQRSKLVSEALTSLGIEFFSPLIETLLIVRGRHLRERRPLLGDYIPVSISKEWRSLLRLRGVRGIILNELGFPAQVLPKEMNHLREMCDDDLYRSTAVEVDNRFEYGQRVSPREGPFADHVGRYQGRVKKGESALFLLFGQDRKVEFKIGDLIAV